MNVWSKVQVRKKKAIMTMNDRKDHQMLLASTYKNVNDFRNIIRCNLGQDDDNDDMEEKAIINQHESSVHSYTKVLKGLFESIDQKDELICSLDDKKTENKKTLIKLREQLRLKREQDAINQQEAEERQRLIQEKKEQEDRERREKQRLEREELER